MDKALTLVAGLAVMTLASLSTASREDPLDAEFRSKVRPLLSKHCASCHAGKKAAGGLDLAKDWTTKSALADRGRWERIAFNVRAKTMPPDGRGPTDAERAVIAEWADKVLSSDCSLADSGKVTIRRLNRTEYRNTLRDLLGIDVDLSQDFPSDDVGSGFDNIGDVLSLSPLYVEKLVSAAEKAAVLSIRLPGPTTVSVDLGRMKLEQGVTLNSEDSLGFFASGRASLRLSGLALGDYVAKIDAYAQQAGPDKAKMRVAVGDTLVQDVVVSAEAANPESHQIPFVITKTNREQEFWIGFPNDYYSPKDPDPKQRDRNLYVTRIELIRAPETVRLPNGPVTMRPKGANDLETPAKDLQAFMRRAYRRPVKAEEVQRLMSVYKEALRHGKVYEAAMRDCVTAVLCSPNFLFRKEEAPAKDNEPVNEFELAARLSYFLWSSTPDDQLLELASGGKLREPRTLAEQVERMLQSSKAKSLGQDFAMQWLQLRKLENVSPDPRLFPGFSSELKQDMATEAQKFFLDALFNNASVLVFLDADYTFLNERLAKVYGAEGVVGDEFRKYKWTDKTRGGLTGMAGILATTSNPNRTSPVKRGKWVLEQLLGTPPPPPPPGAGSLPEDVVLKPTMTMKERLEAHRKKPECATCHRAMDAMGFSLENFDPVGSWRIKDGDLPIDPVTRLPDGTTLDGPLSLRRLLMSRKKDFVKALAERLLTYATGRSMRPQDACHIDKIVKSVEKDGFRFRSLIQAVVASDPFLKKSK